ncbi:MAG: hypothetical protein AB7I35_07205 [Ramlibacter sp.]
MGVAIILLMGFQMIVVMALTRLNKKHFDGRPALEYALVIRDLAKEKPLAAFIIRACYALALLEVLFAYFWVNSSGK